MRRSLSLVCAFGARHGAPLPSPLGSRRLPAHVAALGGSLATVQWLLGGGRGLYAIVGDPAALGIVFALAAFSGSLDVCQWLHSLSPACVTYRYETLFGVSRWLRMSLFLSC